MSPPAQQPDPGHGGAQPRGTLSREPRGDGGYLLRPALAPLITINGCDGYLADFHSAPGPALGARTPDLPRRVGAGADTKNRSRRPRLLLLPGAGKGERGEGRGGEGGLVLLCSGNFPRGDTSKCAKKDP